MPYNKNQIKAYIEEAVEKLQSKCTSKQELELDYFVLIDTNYNSPNIAHSSGYISIPDHLLVSYLEIDMQEIANFSENLVRFIIVHELCHSISKKVKMDRIKPEWKRIGCQNNIKKIKELIIDKMPIISLSDQYADLASDISKINCDLNQEIEHRCIDLCAKNILGLNNEDFIKNLQELCGKSDRNKDLLDRLNAAENEDYEDCINI